MAAHHVLSGTTNISVTTESAAMGGAAASDTD
jgi:hypothetical protein